MNDDIYLPALWAHMLIDTLTEWIGADGTRKIIDSAVSVQPAFNPDDPLRRTLPLHDFTELQVAMRRKISARRTTQILITAGARTFDTLTQGRQVQMPRILSVMTGSVAHHVTTALNYYTDYLNAISDQKAQVKALETGWTWRIAPYPLMDTQIRGMFEVGLVSQMTALATEGDPLDVYVEGAEGTGIVLLIDQPS